MIINSCSLSLSLINTGHSRLLIWIYSWSFTSSFSPKFKFKICQTCLDLKFWFFKSIELWQILYLKFGEKLGVSFILFSCIWNFVDDGCISCMLECLGHPKRNRKPSHFILLAQQYPSSILIKQKRTRFFSYFIRPNYWINQTWNFSGSINYLQINKSNIFIKKASHPPTHRYTHTQKHSHLNRSAMANPRPAGRTRPLKLSNAALLQTLKNAILKQNRLEFKKKSKFWLSKWPFFKNVALEPIWVGHGCNR